MKSEHTEWILVAVRRRRASDKRSTPVGVRIWQQVPPVGPRLPSNGGSLPSSPLQRVPHSAKPEAGDSSLRLGRPSHLRSHHAIPFVHPSSSGPRRHPSGPRRIHEFNSEKRGRITGNDERPIPAVECVLRAKRWFLGRLRFPRTSSRVNPEPPSSGSRSSSLQSGSENIVHRADLPNGAPLTLPMSFGSALRSLGLCLPNPSPGDPLRGGFCNWSTPPNAIPAVTSFRLCIRLGIVHLTEPMSASVLLFRRRAPTSSTFTPLRG